MSAEFAAPEKAGRKVTPPEHHGFPVSAALLAEILGSDVSETARKVAFVTEGDLPSVFAVTDLAAAAFGAAGLAISDLLCHRDGTQRKVRIDRRLASLWFGFSLRPLGWTLPPPWDPIAGDYRTADGWIRLHTNAPRHRAAALRVLGG